MAKSKDRYSDVGIGRAAADQLSFIAGGVEGRKHEWRDELILKHKEAKNEKAPDNDVAD